MDTPACFLTYRAFFINRFTQNIHDASQGLFAHGYGDRRPGTFDRQSSPHAVGTAHGNGPDHAIAQLLLDFED